MKSHNSSPPTDAFNRSDLRLKLYEKAIQESPDLISIMDKNYTYCVVNRMYLERHKKAEGEIIGHHASEILGQAVFEKEMKPSIDRCFEGEEVDYQVWFAFPDLGRRYMDVHHYPLEDDNGSIGHIAVVVRDITDRFKAEEALVKSEERYRRTLDSSHEMITVLDSDGGIVFANKARRDYVGNPVDVVNEVGVFNVLHPEDRERVRSLFQKVIDGESVRGTEYRVIERGGEIRLHESNGAPIHWPGVGNAVLNVTRDITDRKRLEQSLFKEKKRAGQYLEIAGVMLVAIDAEEKVAVINRKGCEILGYREEQIVGKDWFDNFLPERIREDMRAIFRKLVAGETKTVGYYENPVLTANGEEKLIAWRNSVLADDAGNFISALASGEDITERRRMEDALRESEQRYRDIFHEAPDIFYTLDLDTWILTDANRHALEVLEYDPEVIGKIGVSDIVHPDDLERSAGRLTEMVIKKDRMPNFPLRIVSATGKVRHIEQNGVIFWDENGKARTFLGLAHDVTERKRQEETIQKRTERLSALYEIAKVGNETLELNTLVGLIVEVVPRITDSVMAAIFSYDKNAGEFRYLAHRGLSDEAVRETDNLAPDEGIHGQLMKNKTPLLINNIQEYRPIAKAEYVANLGPQSVIAAPLLIKNELVGSMFIARAPGNPYTSHDLGLVTAIANHVAVAIEKASLHSDVLGKEKHLESIFETSHDGIFVTAKDFRLVYRNSALFSMFGYDNDADLGEMDFSEFVAPESIHMLQWYHDRLERQERIYETVEFRGKRRDGVLFDAEADLGYFYEGGERFDVCFIRDVTERKRMEFQLQQSGKLAAIGELAAGVAHEINNPIAAVEVHTGLMREILGDERRKLDQAFCDSLDEYLQTVEHQMHRCHSVTSDLLSFSRSPEESEVTFEVNKLLVRTLDLIVRLTDKKPEVKLSLDDRLPLRYGNPNRLEQVFVNLLSNALKAIEKGGSINIATRLRDNGDVAIKFGDSGPGISAATKTRMFDPFFTTRLEGEGTGLGLSISYYIIRQMNGTLDVESVPGEGATFTITLPGENGEGRG